MCATRPTIHLPLSTLSSAQARLPNRGTPAPRRPHAPHRYPYAFTSRPIRLPSSLFPSAPPAPSQCSYPARPVCAPHARGTDGALARTSQAPTRLSHLSVLMHPPSLISRMPPRPHEHCLACTGRSPLLFPAPAFTHPSHIPSPSPSPIAFLFFASHSWFARLSARFALARTCFSLHASRTVYFFTHPTPFPFLHASPILPSRTHIRRRGFFASHIASHFAFCIYIWGSLGSSSSSS